jgi:hypothetical protein
LQSSAILGIARHFLEAPLCVGVGVRLGIGLTAKWGPKSAGGVDRAK